MSEVLCVAPPAAGSPEAAWGLCSTEEREALRDLREHGELLAEDVGGLLWGVFARNRARRAGLILGRLLRAGLVSWRSEWIGVPSSGLHAKRHTVRKLARFWFLSPKGDDVVDSGEVRR